MHEKFDRYIANLKEAARLIKIHVKPEMSDEEILNSVQDGAQKLRQLCVEDNALLDELVFSRTPESLSPEEAQELSEEAGRLFHYSRIIDVGASLCIHKLLYAYAQLHEDRDMMIRELYFQGLSAFYLNLKVAAMGINVLRDEINDYFAKGAAYFDQWEEISSEETRNYIIRCMANRNLTVPRELEENGLADGQTPEELYARYMRNFDDTMRVVQSPDYRAQNPGIPWDSFLYSMHYDRISFLSLLRQKPNPRTERDVMESAEYIYQRRKTVNRDKDVQLLDSRTIYIYTAARFHSGRITARELMDTLLSVYQQADGADFSIQGIQLNIMYPQYLLAYVNHLPPEEKKLYEPQVEQALHGLYRYLLAMPRNEYINKVAGALQNVMRSFKEQNSFIRTHLLDSILACHAPTYIHSVMVAWLNQRIITQLLEANPAALEGTFGYSGTENILMNREKIRSRAYYCGLYHDLGKSMVINYIGIYGRKLLDAEFHCIQRHPQMGSTLLKEFPEFRDISEVALNHHRSYDGRGGYPRLDRPCSDEMKEIAYITTVSDCLDAATDNIGRSYMLAKSFDTLVGELFQRSGTYYAPEIVQLFEDQKFRENLGRDMVEYRKKLYCRVYRELAKIP